MPASDPITAVANTISSILEDVVKPLMRNYDAHKYDNDYNDTVAKLAAVLKEGSETQPNDLAAFFDKLCNSAGQPVGGLGGKVIEVPVEFVFALGLIAAKEVRDSKLVADFTQLAKSK